MCLDKISRNVKIPREVIAYKVVRYRPYRKSFLAQYYDREFRLNVKHRDANRAMIQIMHAADPAEYYPAGFHAWANPRVACTMFPPQTILRVRLRDITTVGIQHGRRVYVSKKLEVLSVYARRGWDKRPKDGTRPHYEP